MTELLGGHVAASQGQPIPTPKKIMPREKTERGILRQLVILLQVGHTEAFQLCVAALPVLRAWL